MTMYRWVAAALFVAALPAVAAAQTDQGKLSGTVLDTSGASVAGATVSARNERTGEQRVQVASENGTFLIDNLKPSTCTIRAAKTRSPLFVPDFSRRGRSFSSGSPPTRISTSRSCRRRPRSRRMLTADGLISG